MIRGECGVISGTIEKGKKKEKKGFAGFGLDIELISIEGHDQLSAGKAR